MPSEGVVVGLGAGGTEALCTLGDLIEGVFAFLRDDERIFVTETFVKNNINEAYLDLNARLRLKQVKLDGTADADGIITLPEDFVEMISLWFDGLPVALVDDSTYESWAEPSTSEPFTIIARFYANQFETYPAQADTDYTLRYVGRPDLLDAESDQPVWITPELCVRLKKYALSEALRKEGEVGQADAYMAEYQEGLPGRPRVMHRMRPAPVSLIPEPGPFDV